MLHACVTVAVVVVVLAVVPVLPPCPTAPVSDDLHLTDQLLTKCEKEQTNYDVQIGDGMDIVIVGENGKV